MLTMERHNSVFKTVCVYTCHSFKLLVRFHIHSKLINFMAPIDNSSMSDDAR